MPRRSKASTAAEKKDSPAEPKEPKVNKIGAIKDALKAHPRKSTKEIAELLSAQGIEVTQGYVATTKSKLKGKRKRARAGVTPAPEAAPSLPKDAVSIALLQKAKKVVKDLGGVKAAKQAIDALAQLLD